MFVKIEKLLFARWSLKIKKLKKLCINKCLLSLSTLHPPHKTPSPYSPNTSTLLKNFLPSHQKPLHKNPSKLPNKYSTHTHSLPLQTTQPHTLLKIKKSHFLLLKKQKISPSQKSHISLPHTYLSHTPQSNPTNFHTIPINLYILK